MKIGTIKENTPEAQPHVIPKVGKAQKLAPEWKEAVHTNMTPDKAPRESTMLPLLKMCFFFHWKQQKNKTTHGLRLHSSHRPQKIHNNSATNEENTSTLKL